MSEEEAGWGSGPFGDLPWGDSDNLFALGGSTIPLAVRENVIRLEFNELVFLNGLGDQWDAGDPAKWSVSEDTSSVGADGLPARAVRVAGVELAKDVDPGEFGRFVDLVLDRPLSPWPALYSVTFATIYNASKSDSVSGTTPAFPATFRVLDLPRIDSPLIARDLANPQTLSAALEAIPNAGAQNGIKLGTYSIDDTGDYAFDSGMASLKKRIVRRLITVPDGFAHLRNYGVGILRYVKQLASVELQSRLATIAEEQISREPEVAKCRVVFLAVSGRPGLYHLRIYVRTRQGLSQRFEMPLSPAMAQAA